MIRATGMESVIGPGLMLKDGQGMDNGQLCVRWVSIVQYITIRACLTVLTQCQKFIECLHTACTGLKKLCRGCLLGHSDACKP
jgi:hypothetical protein